VDEVDQVDDYLIGLGQMAVWSMAYPYGDASWEPIAAERFLLARGVQSGRIQALAEVNPLLLPTIAANEGDPASKFIDAIGQVRDEGSWAIFLFHTIRPTSSDWYAGVDVSAVTESISSAQQSGDIWLDSVVNVGAYWLAEKLLADVTPSAVGDAQVWTWSLPAHFPPGKYVRVVVDGGTLTQGGAALPWDDHGYYEVSLDSAELSWSP
jgi:hypothetical protein